MSIKGDHAGREPRQKGLTLPLSTIDGGFGRDITPTVFSPGAMYDNQPYAFGASTQYWTVLEKAPGTAPAMVDDPAEARVFPIPPGHRFMQFLEVQLGSEILADEDLTIEVVGCVHDPLGPTLLHDEPLLPFDTPIQISFVAGDRASKRSSTLRQLLIGGQLATHYGFRYKLDGGTIHQGLLSGIAAFKP